MDYACGKGQPPSRRRYHWFLLGGVMGLMLVMVIGLVSYIDDGRASARGTEAQAGTAREVPSPGYPGSHAPAEQLSVAGEAVPENLVAQEQQGQPIARSDEYARRYTKEDQMVERDPAADEQGPPFKLPELPIPSDILDLPIEIPTDISDIIGDLPLPTVPTDIGDIVDGLPTDPGEIISAIPTPPPVPLSVPPPVPPKVPELPSLPFPTPPRPVPKLPEVPRPVPKLPEVPRPVPKLPEVPRPVPKLPEVPRPVPKLPELPIVPIPLPTLRPAGVRPRDPPKLPDLLEIPHRVIALLHHAVTQLSNNPKLPKPVRDVLRLILRILSRLAGGAPVPKPPGTSLPTLPVPVPTLPPLPTGAPTRTRLPFPSLPFPRPRPSPPPPEEGDPPSPTLPTGAPTVTVTTRVRPSLPPLFPPRPTLTLPVRARQEARGGGGAGVGDDNDKEPLSEGQLKQLRDAVSDEVWSSADWSNPILAPITAAGAMLAFDAVYLIAEAFKGTNDEAEQEKLLSLLVVVDDDDDEAMAEFGAGRGW